MTNLQQAINLAKTLRNQNRNRLYVIRELRIQFDMGFASADFVYHLSIK